MSSIEQLLTAFEKRNNISVELRIYSDLSGSLNEFWDGEQIFEFQGLTTLELKLTTTNLELDENGLCYSPFRFKNP